MNEEEIKVKYVLPWLTQAGVAINDLQLERTFSVTIGRQTIRVPATPIRGNTSARLDILVRRGGENLFIVETKAAHLPLTDDDRDQAISYARLVHPIAPYAVVTNGSEYRLYDSLTKASVNPSTIRIRGFEAALPDTAIAEAQQLFLALNRSNLSLFCERQVAGELRVIKGTIAEARKYVPDLHVSRQAILSEIDAFYRSTYAGLLLVAQSGSGKTCELCALAESLVADGKPVLFFNGFSLERGILDAIANEFAWTFTGSDVPIEVVKRIESFVRDDALTIIVDAIDEWMFDSRVNHLASLLKAAEQRRIKIVFSCKTSAVEQFLSQRGIPTAVSDLAKRVDVPAFSPREFFQVIERYQHAYQVFGGFENVVVNQAKDNPFLLRVLFDVARDSNVKHHTFSSAEFFEAYYERSLRRTSDARRAAQTLNAIARLLYERNTEWISEGELRAALGLGVNESLMEELFEYAILLRHVGDATDAVIGFYFQQLRDYIIAFKALQFNKMTPPALESKVKEATFPGVRGDVFALYYRLASREHRLLFDREVRQNAAKYLHWYTALIQEHFPALKAAVRPRTSGRIGFIGELFIAQQRLGMYGFRALGDGDEEVYFTPIHQPERASNLTYLSGADQLHVTGGSRGFRDGIDIRREVVDHEVLPQIRRLVQEGKLNESSNPDMLSELVVESVRRQKDVFRQLLMPDRRTVRYPLRLASVRECLLREKLRRHFRDGIIDRKRGAGEIRDEWRGSVVSYSYSHTPADEVEIKEKVERAMSANEIPRFRARYVDLDELEASLSPAVSALSAIRAEITAPLLERDRIELEALKRGPAVTPDLKVYLCNLYSIFLSNYKTIVDVNFPTLRSRFQLYSQMPISVYLVFEPPLESRFGYFSMPLSMYCARGASEGNVVEVVDEVLEERSERGLQFIVGGILRDGIFWSRTTVGSVLASNAGLTYDQFREMSLRSLVYSKLLSEFKECEDAFRGAVEAVRE